MNLFFQFAAEYWYLFVGMLVILLLISADEMFNPANKRITFSELGPKVNDNDGLIIDVSSENEYQNAHIAGAQSLPLTRIEEADSLFNKYMDKPVVVVCQSGQKSRTAAQKLFKMGYKDVYHLQGGMAEWQRENMPVVRGNKKTAKTSAKSAKAKAKSQAKATSGKTSSGKASGTKSKTPSKSKATPASKNTVKTAKKTQAKTATKTSSGTPSETSVESKTQANKKT